MPYFIITHARRYIASSRTVLECSFAILIAACDSSPDKSPPAAKTAQEDTIVSARRHTKPAIPEASSHDLPPSYTNTYPFSKANRIEILSYRNKDGFGGEVIGENERMITTGLDIRDRIPVPKSSFQTLYTALYFPPTETFTTASCYYPANAVLFLDSGNQPFAAIEICFHCYQARGTDGVPDVEFTADRLHTLTALFRKLGVKYFGEDNQ